MKQSKLEKQFISFEKYCKGTLGIEAFHIETGESVKYNSEKRFLMCSTYKVPMAICLLQQIENGTIKLTDYLEVTEFNLRPGIIGTLNQLSYRVPVKISIENLLRFMMQESCNTSTDIILRIIGGPPAVMRFLQNSGIADMQIDRYTLEVMSQWDGIKQLPNDHQITLTQYKKMEDRVSSIDLTKSKK